MITSPIKSSFVFFTSIAVTLFIFSTVSIPNAYACSCALPTNPRIQMMKSDAVFAGKVTSIQKALTENSMLDKMMYDYATFTVTQSWKNISSNEVVVMTPESGASCGFGFSQDEEYIVYANKDTTTGALTTHLCSRTNLLSQAGEDLARLGDGTLPTPANSPSKQLSKNARILILVIGGVLGTGIFIAIQKKKAS